MDADLKDLWAKTLEIIKSELSEVSFNTWIKSCEPISISSDTYMSPIKLIFVYFFSILYSSNNFNFTVLQIGS